MQTSEQPQCLYCQMTDEQMPLVSLRYQGRALYICAQHLPLLIHEPQKLVGKLPGAEKMTGAQHD